MSNEIKNDHTRENDGKVSIHFSSPLDFMEVEPTNRRNKSRYEGYMDKERYDSRALGPAKYAGKVMEEAILGSETLDKMLEEKISWLNEELRELNPHADKQLVQKSKRRKKRDSHGDELDIHAVNSGNLDRAWTRSYREVFDKQHSLVTLVIDVGANWGEDAVSSLWQSAIASKLLDDMTKARKSVQIVLANSGEMPFTDSRKKLTCSIVAKKYNERLTSSRLASMSHLGYFRVAFFAQMCLAEYTLSGGLGHHIPLESNLPIQLEDEIAAGHTHPIFIGQVRSGRQALQYLNEIYNSK